MCFESDLDKLAFQFFKLFAEYEARLKENGFYIVGKIGNISVDWNRFSNQIIGKDYKDKLRESIESVMYILENPPHKQVHDGFKIHWSPATNNEKSSQMLFSHICRIRNNLFHGAKFNGSWHNPERNEKLLKCAIDILITTRPYLP